MDRRQLILLGIGGSVGSEIKNVRTESSEHHSTKMHAFEMVHDAGYTYSFIEDKIDW